MAINPNGWTHVLIASLPCGCFTGATTVQAISPESLGNAIRENLKRGLLLSFAEWDDRAAQNRHCADYPHEQWQIDYERRLEAFAKGTHTPSQSNP